MNGMNLAFMNNPVWFLNQVCVDNKTMQQGHDGAKNIAALNGAKFGSFDLVPAGEKIVRLAYIEPGYKIQGDVPILAYWCPFLAGGGLPGWVDIPRIHPPKRFIFTAAMQGCALVVTNSPASSANFRVFHNQHPEAHSTTWTAMQNGGIASVISSLGYEQYGNPTNADGGMTNAFNLLWRPEGKAWSYVSQSNIFVPLPKGLNIARDAGKPILDLPAGV